MNIGSNILNLRKQKNITQEALAAELGVTAAAVSKWEKGYTLPDIMMLCALADFFGVTTDALLGRVTVKKGAIVVAQTPALGEKIARLAGTYGIVTRAILTEYAEAVAIAKAESEQGNRIHYLFTATDHPLAEREMDDTDGIIHVNVHVNTGKDEDALNGIELYLKNMDAFHNLTNLSAQEKR